MAGALAVPRARRPVLKSGLVWEPPPHRPWPLAVQPQLGVSRAPARTLQHVTTLQPACRATAPVGMNLPAPPPPVLASVLWVTLRWLWVPGAHAHRPRCRGHAPCLGALCHQPQLISRDEAGEEMRLSCPSLLFSPGLDLSGMGA